MHDGWVVLPRLSARRKKIFNKKLKKASQPKQQINSLVLTKFTYKISYFTNELRSGVWYETTYWKTKEALCSPVLHIVRYLVRELHDEIHMLRSSQPILKSHNKITQR